MTRSFTVVCAAPAPPERSAIRIMAAGGGNVQYTASFTDTAGVIHSVTSAVVAAGEWHHVLGSLAEPTLRLWVDGERSETGDTRLGAPARSTGCGSAATSGELEELYISTNAISDDDTALARFCPVMGVHQ